MNAQREITKLKRENERLQKQIKLLAIGLDVVLCANAGIGEGDHEAWECEMSEHEGNPTTTASDVWNQLKNL
jgi:hypothetical protein